MSYYKQRCTDLVKDSEVLFMVDPYFCNQKSMFSGNVISVDNKRKVVTVIYLEGYKSRTDDIPFNDMIAVYNPKGPFKKYQGYSGPSIDLIPE